MRTLRFRGPDLDSSTPAELVSFRARVNNALKRLGSGWCVHVECSRRPSRHYPDPTFANGVAGLIDAERRRSFTDERAQFESFCFLTLQYLPPPKSKARLADLFIDRPPPATGKGVDYSRSSGGSTRRSRRSPTCSRRSCPTSSCSTTRRCCRTCTTA